MKFSLVLSTIALSTAVLAQSAKEVEEANELTRKAEWAKAAPAWEKIVKVNPVNGYYWQNLAQAKVRLSEYKDAIPALHKVIELGAGYPFQGPYDMAICYARMDDKEKCYEWLKKSFDLGYRFLDRARQEPAFAAYKADPRFEELLALKDVSKMSRDEGWRYDLWLYARELKRIHFNPFAKMTEAEYDAMIRKIHDDIPRLNDSEIELRFREIAASMGDGHTRVFGNQQNRRFLPINMFLFQEGMYVTSASAENKDLVGAKVLSIGGKKVEDVMRSLEPAISRDNSMGIVSSGPAMLRSAHIVHGLGLSPDLQTVAISVEDRDGKTRSVDLKTLDNGSMEGWPSVIGADKTKLPLYLKRREDAYWYEYLPKEKLVYFQYNSVANRGDETLAQFCEKLFKFIDDNDVKYLVLDMRWNGGGNNFLNQPILEGLIRTDKINAPGHTFAILGRGTFSAAICGATQFWRFSNVTFVGEPCGSGPNFVGESIQVSLPYSKMGGSISDLYWQNSFAMDYRTWLAPDIYAPPTFELYKQHRDPAMEAILASIR